MAQFNTEHDHGDEVWYLNAHFKAVQGNVSSVQITTQSAPSAPGQSPGQPVVLIQYLIDSRYFGEERVFKTKEELINHISNDL